MRALRAVFSEGCMVERWRNKMFNGRAFNVNCKGNATGLYVEFAILGAKKRLKTLMIPTGVRGGGLVTFADALAATTAGPDRICVRTTPPQESGLRARQNLTNGHSFSDMVSQGKFSSEPEDNGIKEQSWVTL